MERNGWLLHSACMAALVLAGCHPKSPGERDAAPIVSKNAAARGGVSAWRGIRTMSLSGTLDAGKPRDPVKLARSYQRARNQVKADERRAARSRPTPGDGNVRLPFKMDLLRPRKSRVEVVYRGDTAVQVYDGKQGWKVRPFLGRREVEPFNAEELRIAAQQSELDGPLLDAAANGGRVALVGSEKVDGRDAWKLEVTAGDGAVRHVWVDQETYLDVKVDGTRRLDGRLRPVFTWLRDYRLEGGVMIPHQLETAVEGVPGVEKLVVERVVLNPKLDDAHFGRPN
jgi:hypothetical protein